MITMKSSRIWLLLGMAFMIGWFLPSPSTDRMCFHIRHPRVSFEYDLESTSYDLLVHDVRVRFLSEAGLLNAIYDMNSTEIRPFIERQRQSLTNNKRKTDELLSKMKREIEKGGVLYKYNYRNGKESGLLILSNDQIALKFDYYGGVEGSGDHFKSAGNGT